MGNDSSPSFADQRLRAFALAAHLDGLPWSERLRKVRADRAYGKRDFIELTVAIARDSGLPAAERERWARLGVEAVRRGGSRHAEEIEALAWAALGNAHRVCGRLVMSRDAFARCRASRGRLSDPLHLAETLSLEASYLYAVGEFEGGAELIEEALRLAVLHADDSVIGLYEIKAGNIADRAGRKSVAMAMHLSALDRIDPGENPRLALLAGHNLAASACSIGQLDAAMAGILRLQPCYELSGDLRIRLNRDLLVGRITRARGYRIEAALRLRSVRDRFLEHHWPLDAAGVDLDLAEMAVETDSWPEVAHLAARAFRAFSAAGAMNHTRLAVGLLREARLRRPSGARFTSVAIPSSRLSG